MNRRLPMMLVPSLVMALSLSAAGQDTKPKANPSPAPTQEKPAALPAGALADTRVVDIEFPGGTFGDFIELIQNNATPRANFVASPTILETTVGKLSLRRLSVLSALNAAITASDDQSSQYWRIEIEGEDGRDTLYRITVDPRVTQMAPGRQQSPGRTLEVFPYREAIGPADSVLSAIENALQMLHEKAPPIISFHKQSGLLFVSGTRAHAEIVQNVLQAMENRANSTKDAMDIATARQLIQAMGTRDAKTAQELLKSLQTRAAALDVAKVEAAASTAAHEARLEAAEREREEIRRRSEVQMDMVAKEMMDLRNTCEKLRNEALAIRSENERLRAELATLKPAAAAPAQPK